MRKLIFLTIFALAIGILVSICTLVVFRHEFNQILPRKFKRFYTSGSVSATPGLKFCRHFKHKERTNWNHLYFYEGSSVRRSAAAEKGLIWCKIPKAGSTTLTHLFLTLAGVKLTNATKAHKILRVYYPKLTEKEIRARMSGSFKFLVVRDPFERLLSAYRDKLESYERDLAFRNGYYFEHYGKFMTAQPPQRNGTKIVPTWPQFVDYLSKTSVARYDEHWTPMHRLCTPCSFPYDAVIRIENFTKQIQMHFKKLKIVAPSTRIGWAHRTGTNSKLVEKYYQNLTQAQVKKLYTVYKKDFQIFGYSPFKYFRMADGGSGSGKGNGNGGGSEM